MPLTRDIRQLCRQIDCPVEPCDVFTTVSKRRIPFFLDSGMDPQRLGRYSFLGCDPFLVVEGIGTLATATDAGGQVTAFGHPFELLRSLLLEYSIEHTDGPAPFTGGAVGCLSYDLCHLIESLPRTAQSDLGFSDLHLGFYHNVLAYDHVERQWFAIATPLPGESSSDVRQRSDNMLRMFDEAFEFKNGIGCERKSCETALQNSRRKAKGNFSREAYLRAVERVIEYIHAGDVFEVNLSQRFNVECNRHPADVYQSLRSINPAPFACYFDFGSRAAIGASPERFLLVKDKHVWTRPIKGTRRRIGDPAIDEKARKELLSSAKDRAELTMIVDLERNDLGRVCEYGSVNVTEPFVLEEYPSVFHLVSTVEGDLHPRYDVIDLLKSTFPGGSITGAPKIRSMEIIDELEPTQRSLYTGSMGYIGFDGSVDLNIAIRTILMEGNQACFQVGGAVVADSVPESEYQETLDKGQRLFAVLGAELPDV